MSCLMINDIDAGLGRFGELPVVWTGKIGNTQNGRRKGK